MILKKTVITTLFAIAICQSASASGGDVTVADQFSAQVQQLKQQLAAMEVRHDAQIAALRNEDGDRWLTQQRADEIREIVKDVLADSESRSNLQGAEVTAGWNKGFMIASADGNFKMVVSGQIQSRFSYNYQPASNRTAGNQSPSDEYGFEMRRVKLGFEGNVLDPSWTYRVRFSFNQNAPIRQSPGKNQDTSNSAVLEEVVLRKNFGNGWTVRAGQWKSKFNYEESVSSSVQQFVERTLVGQYFKTGFIQGIELLYETANWRANVNYNDGGGDSNVGVVGTASASDNTAQWATAGRAELKLAGEWKQFSQMMSFRGSDDGMQIGAAYNWQRGGGNNQLNPGFVGNSDGMNISYNTDFNARLNGASFFASFLGNSFYSRPDGAAPVNSYGVVVQGGYFINNDVELAARWEWMNVSGGTTNVDSSPTPGSASAINAQHFSIYTIGATYYISKNAIKLAGDIGYVAGAVLFSNGLYNQAIAGADYRSDQTSDSSGQMVVRVQLQLLF